MIWMIATVQIQRCILVSLLRLRTGKIVELACASKEYDAFADLLTDEEQKLFEQLVSSIALLKKEVLQELMHHDRGHIFL